MNLLFAASEAVPFMKSGGLADVVGALAKTMQQRGHTCRVVLPLYQDIPDHLREQLHQTHSFFVPLGWRSQYCGVLEGMADGVQYLLLDNEYYFKRHGSYGFFDDAERFAFFSRAICELLLHMECVPEILHCNDWQTGLVPAYLRVFYNSFEQLKKLRTVFTIHNILYQGSCGIELVSNELGLPAEAAGLVEYNGSANLLKGGIESCDALTTVSPTYAREILTPWHAHGLDGLLRERQHKLHGILNGIDTAVYNPATDPLLPVCYNTDNLSGKAADTQALRQRLCLCEDDTMLIAMVSRLAEHKGIDLVRDILDLLMERPVQLVLLGAGDWGLETFFRDAAARYPGRISVTLGFDEALAHQIYGGADCFLMPSRSEPCGLAQMIALRYGTIPIVRSVGGLRDTVRDFGGDNGNGYTFQSDNACDMLHAVDRALLAFRSPQWSQQVAAAMHCDFSWNTSADAYLSLYQNLSNVSTSS